MIYTTEEIAFLSDDTGIVYYHLGDGALTSDSPMAKPDMSLLYSANDEITPEWHEKKISRRAAATTYGVSSKNIVISDNICWVISDNILESSEETRNFILPLGALVIHRANLLFGPKSEDRQIILSMGKLARPLTYVLTIIAGQVTESILHGDNPKKIFTRTCKEVVRIDIALSHTEESLGEYEPPEADIIKEVSLIDFLAPAKLKPIFLGVRILPWKKSLPLLAVLSLILVLSKGFDLWAKEQELSLDQKIIRVEKELAGAELSLKSEWRNVLSFFVDRDRRNYNPVFSTIDSAAQILSLRTFKVDRRELYFELVGDPTVGASENTRIRNEIQEAFKDCKIKESYNLPKTNEILYSINCSY